jgi:hypothetical protein
MSYKGTNEEQLHLVEIENEQLQDRIEELERQIAAGLACDQHQFINYKPDLNERRFFEVADAQAALTPKEPFSTDGSTGENDEDYNAHVNRIWTHRE